ncbi:hypothetical protein NBRC116589_25940 [Ruegeria sp. HU-ET01832]
MELNSPVSGAACTVRPVRIKAVNSKMRNIVNSPLPQYTRQIAHRINARGREVRESGFDFCASTPK